MNRELLSRAISDIDDRFIAEACLPASEEPAAPSERIVHMKKKRIITLALAAMLILALGATAYAGYASVSSPQAAEKVAREQLEVWKELGLITQDFTLEGSADRVIELAERNGGPYWYGRLFPHSYQVEWYCHPVAEGGPKYGGVVAVDTLSGKISWATLYAAADPDEEPVGSTEATAFEPGVGETTHTLYFYDNFDDIFPADVTVDRFCSLLAEYWGFTGYRLAETVDTARSDSHWPAVDGATLLKDLPKLNPDNYYLTVFFEGDQEGAPMYIGLDQFPGHVILNIGTNHGIG